MKVITNVQKVNPVSVVQNVSGDVIDLTKAGGVALVSNITVDTNANAAFTSAAVSTINSTITLTAHGFKTGLKVQFTTSGSLPTGLVTSTNYFIIAVDANTISLGSSLVNALAGTKITLSAAGSGSSSCNPVALAGATIQMQWSLDQVTWIPISTATAISASAVFSYTQDRPAFRYVQPIFTLTAGSLTVATLANVNQDS